MREEINANLEKYITSDVKQKRRSQLPQLAESGNLSEASILAVAIVTG
ncbi:MAG: hypothetical protein SFV81_00250 [Pirellulaceae bacterium]|nr:hypothetical protein [Pirellulaceae bacterium]